MSETVASEDSSSLPGRWRRLMGLAVVLCVTGTQVASTQMTKTVQSDLHAPFFVMVLHTSCATIMLPVARIFAKPGERALAPLRFVMVALPLWLVSVYFYVDALVFAPAGLVQTIFGTAPAIVAVLSYIFLREPLARWRKVAVTVAFFGIAAVSVSTRRQDTGTDAISSTVGALLSFCAVLGAAGYKVSLKVFMPQSTLSVVLKYTGTPGLVTACLGFPVAALLSLCGVEDRWWSSDVNWSLLMFSTLVNVAYSLAVALGVALTNPTFVAFGTIAGIPVNLAIDALMRGVDPLPLEVLGAVLIVTSFGLAQLPVAPQEAREPLQRPDQGVSA